MLVAAYYSIFLLGLEHLQKQQILKKLILKSNLKNNDYLAEFWQLDVSLHVNACKKITSLNSTVMEQLKGEILKV